MTGVLYCHNTVNVRAIISCIIAQCRTLFYILGLRTIELRILYLRLCSYAFYGQPNFTDVRLLSLNNKRCQQADCKCEIKDYLHWGIKLILLYDNEVHFYTIQVSFFLKHR